MRYLNIKRFRLLFFLLFFSSALIANAQEFTATVTPASVDVGDQFQITFSLNTTGKNFRPPSFSDFNVLMGPNQSTQMQISNGAMSQTISFTYVLEATKEGTFKIGPAEIMAGSNKALSNIITMVVTKGAGKSQSPAGGQPQGGDNSATLNGGKNVFVSVSVDKNSVYQGEGVGVTYRLYTKVTLLNYSITKLPSFNGFWSQDVAVPQQPEFKTETVDGVQYKVADIKKVILFPQRTGSLTIDAMEGEVIARVQMKRQQQRSNDPFNQFFNDPFFNNPFFNNNVQDVKVALKSDPVKMNVKELPAGKPDAFTGAVGNFAYEVSLDKSEVKAHDAVNLKIKISGKGNIKLIDPPKIDFPADFETYDPKENVSSNATAHGVTGTKTFEYLLIPKNAGDFKIPVEPFSFFNLEKKEFQTIKSPEISLHVSKGSETDVTVISGVNKSDVQMLGKDIRFIKTNEPEFRKKTAGLLYSGIFYSLVTIPAAAFLLLLFVRKRKQALAGNVRLVKSQRANKVAMKRLVIAKKYLSSNEKEKFLDEMFRALWGFISDKLQIPVSDLSKDSVSLALISRNVPEPIVISLIETLDACEFARFAGAMGDSNEVIYNKGIEIISKLENSIA